MTEIIHGIDSLPEHREARSGDGRRPAAFVALAWTLLIGTSFAINRYQHTSDAETQAQLVASAYIDKDLAVRRWIAEHGGVYVPPTEHTPPNPYLKVPERDVRTVDGRALTLVNPAYATRQLMEAFSERHGIQGHLTALVLRNPNNAPDDWERRALERLTRGETTVNEAVERDGVPTLRQMRPVYMEKGCLRCHGDMGIPVGGLRGGISIAVPMQPYLAMQQAALRSAMGTHGLIWLVGLAGIVLTQRRNAERRAERQRLARIGEREERRVVEVLSLSERLDMLGERELIQLGLETAVRLTDSRIGYFHFVNDDQKTLELVTWSKDTLEHYCTAAYDRHYPLDQAGVWADCARLREPVVHNDYPNLPARRGLPEGHAPLQRHMSVPVIESGKVRVITGVGNKEAPYDHNDVRLLQLLANDLWKLIQRKRADVELRASESLLKEAQRLARMGSWSLNHETGAMTWSDETYAILELDPKSFVPTAEAVTAVIHPDDRALRETLFAKAIAEHRDFDMTLRVLVGEKRTKLLQLHGVTQYAPDGKPQITVGTAQDISEKQEVEVLRRSEANLSALFEHTDRQIWSIDTERRLVIGNSLFLADMEAMVGRPVVTGETMPPAGLDAAEADEWLGYYRRCLQGESFGIETQRTTPGNATRWIEYAFYPINDGGRVLGVTVFGRDLTERRHMEETQVQTLKQMSQVMRKLEVHHRKTLQINRLNDLLQSSRSEHEALDVIRLSLADVFSGESGCLALVLGGARELERVAAWGDAMRVPAAFEVDDCWALRRGEAHEARHRGDLACAHFTAVPENGYLCLPLVVRGDTLGLLHLAFPPGATDDAMTEVRDLGHAVGETIKLSLSNLRLRVALQEQATHDVLTGLFNRRYLDETLPRELHRVQRAGGELTLAMLDIDHFKRFNDDMGHEAGDLILRGIGRILREHLRKSDIGCRYGGEELLLIMPDSTPDDAQARLTEICDLIRSMKIRYREDVLPSVTVSVGIAGTAEQTTHEAVLLRAADDALYAAKAAGRDRIVIASPPPATRANTSD